MRGETENAHARRLREGWYDRYAPFDAAGIDIGALPDPIHPESQTWFRWNAEHGDATHMQAVQDESYSVVYASHILEDLVNPIQGLRSWHRILRPHGYLIVCVPHRDLYERSLTLPSKFNGAHRSFWLPDRFAKPVTRSFYHTFREALPQAEFISLRVLDEGYIERPPDQHAVGEYSIELIARK